MSDADDRFVERLADKLTNRSSGHGLASQPSTWIGPPSIA